MNVPRDDKKPIRYGITPSAFMTWSWIGVLFGAMFLADAIFRLVSWLFR